ncbi:hypothetical protein JB92DRAFT_2831230 [Gautieria morchelliformis]|nr:hypothetical protein JB92DRAFT_2831230 [Gautieria morchelliformis]
MAIDMTTTTSLGFEGPETIQCTHPIALLLVAANQRHFRALFSNNPFLIQWSRWKCPAHLEGYWALDTFAVHVGILRPPDAKAQRDVSMKSCNGPHCDSSRGIHCHMKVELAIKIGGKKLAEQRTSDCSQLNLSTRLIWTQADLLYFPGLKDLVQVRRQKLSGTGVARFMTHGEYSTYNGDGLVRFAAACRRPIYAMTNLKWT